MEKTIGAFEARRNLGKLIEEAFYKKDAFIIERSGRPMAVIVSVEEYQAWQQLAKEQVFRLLESAQQRSQGASTAQVERDTRAALSELRQPAKRKTRAA